jgi:prophage regulatory protein
MSENLLTYSQVLKLTGIRSRSTIFERVQRGEFPAPLKLSPGYVRLRESEILAWIESLPRQHY